MGKFSAVFLAAIQYSFGFFIFKKPEVDPSARWTSCLIVLIALLLILWSIPIWPTRLRKLTVCCNFMAQYLIAAFLIEHFMANFWFPLEQAIMGIPGTAGQVLDAITDGSTGTVSDLLKDDFAKAIVSYTLSFLTMIAALHATRIINLNLLLQFGFTVFYRDISRRAIRFWKNNIYPCLIAPLGGILSAVPWKRNDDGRRLKFKDSEDDDDDPCRIVATNQEMDEPEVTQYHFFRR